MYETSQKSSYYFIKQNMKILFDLKNFQAATTIKLFV